MADKDRSASSADASVMASLSRRKLLAGIGGLAVGTAIGGGYALFDAKRGGRGIEPVEPNADGEATLGEFHYILEERGADNARLDVTELRYLQDEDVIHVTYETRATANGDVEPRRQYVREVGQVIAMFSTYVSQGGELGTVIETQIEHPEGVDNLPSGYYVWREWVRKYAAGEWNESRVLNRVLGSSFTNTTTPNSS